MTARERTPCVVCGATRWTALPDPGPQSMASDWRVVPEALARFGCESCGLARRWPDPAAQQSLYARGYGLYAHAPGESRERARQAQYAAWIAGAVPVHPNRVLDVGCGNGSLLLALRAHWPDAVLRGCDPSAESVASGRAHGLEVWQGSGADLPGDAASDVVVSVNVIEHTLEPRTFLRGLRESLGAGGALALVYPDGGRPNLELLFADHVFSFAPAHLRALMESEGFEVESAGSAPADLGAFQLAVARRREGSPAHYPPLPLAPSAAAARRRYLAAWRGLDETLLERLSSSVVCFGAGEAAGLLRAYAPRSWGRVRACTIDGEDHGRFGDLPLIALDDVRADETVLVGVRPIDQRRVSERLRARFSRVVVWYDLLDGGGDVW